MYEMDMTTDGYAAVSADAGAYTEADDLHGERLLGSAVFAGALTIGIVGMHMMIEPLLLFETVLIEDRPITDLIDPDFVARHREGFGQLKAELADCTPQWASRISG